MEKTENPTSVHATAQTLSLDDTAERDLCLGSAKTLGYPEIDLRPGHKVPAGETVWLRFTENSSASDLEDAQQALDRLGEEVGA